MAEMLTYGFMLRAFLAVIMIGLLCSVLSFFVVLNRLSFMGAGISHAILGGLAIGVLAGINPLYTGGIFGVGLALLAGYISKQSRIREDTIIGIFFVTGMALGIILISLQEGYFPELFSLLFGNVLAVTVADLRFLGTVMIVVLLFILIFFKELLTISFDPELAQANGLPVTCFITGRWQPCSDHCKFCSSRWVVLASALLVIPPLPVLCSQNYRGMILLGIVVGLASGLGGLSIYNFNIPVKGLFLRCFCLFYPS